MNKNFLNELSLYCKSDIYEKINCKLYTKKKYLDSIMESKYYDLIIPYLPLEDFLYVFNLLDSEEEEILSIFKKVCYYGDIDKIKFICYNNKIERDNVLGVDILKIIIPHLDKNLFLYIMNYFSLWNIILFSHSSLFNLICIYDFNCLESFNNINIITKSHILKTIDYNSFNVYVSSMNIYFEKYNDSNYKSWEINLELSTIADYCIEKNKINFLKYINNIKPMNTFYEKYKNKKIRTFDMYLYLRDNVKNKDLLDKHFFYYMLTIKNDYMINKCIELNPHLICICNHMAIEIADKSIRPYLIKIHMCKKDISLETKKYIRVSNILDNISTISDSIHDILNNIE